MISKLYKNNLIDEIEHRVLKPYQKFILQRRLKKYSQENNAVSI